jgi:hypothetical protein
VAEAAQLPLIPGGGPRRRAAKILAQKLHLLYFHEHDAEALLIKKN